MMEEIRAQQVNRARPMTGRDFVLGVASVVRGSRWHRFFAIC